MNRKEPFYTATVLPGIISADGFAHLGRFLALVGRPGARAGASGSPPSVAILTEYDLVAAIKGHTDSPHAESLPERTRTPDLALLIEGDPPLLVSVEGKAFLKKDLPALVRQMNAQKVHFVGRLCGIVRRELGRELDVVEVALLPRYWQEDFLKLGSIYPGHDRFRTLAWEDIADAYRDVAAAAYWIEALDRALGFMGEEEERRRAKLRGHRRRSGSSPLDAATGERMS